MQNSHWLPLDDMEMEVSIRKRLLLCFHFQVGMMSLSNTRPAYAKSSETRIPLLNDYNYEERRDAGSGRQLVGSLVAFVDY